MYMSGCQAWIGFTCSSVCRVSRFLSSPFIVRVPFFLLFGFDKGTLNKKKGGKRVLLRNLGL